MKTFWILLTLIFVQVASAATYTNLVKAQNLVVGDILTTTVSSSVAETNIYWSLDGTNFTLSPAPTGGPYFFKAIATGHDLTTADNIEFSNSLSGELIGTTSQGNGFAIGYSSSIWITPDTNDVYIMTSGGSVVLFPMTGKKMIFTNSIPNPLAWYKFTEGSGTTTADSGSSGTTLTLHGSAAFATGPTGHGAMSFSATNSYLTATGSPASLDTVPLTWTWWQNSTLDFTANGTIIGGVTRGGQPVIWETFNSTGLTFNSDQVAAITTVTGLTLAGSWHMIALSFDGTTSTVYLDGTPISTNTVSALTFSTKDLEIGSTGFANGQAYTGALADVRIYGSVLSAATISSLNAAGAQ